MCFELRVMRYAIHDMRFMTSMINFLHTYHPQPILISLGPINIYWYGLFIVLGALAAILVTLKLASYYGVKKQLVIDLAFWLIIFGIIGARIYHIFLELPYYLNNPLDIFKIWRGGLAIHGAIISGLITVWILAKKYKHNFWQITALIAPGLVLAQAIGRWGNYFNQELFGLPTNLPWGIPIDIINRPIQYLSFEYFQPTFLYESLGNLAIFIILIICQIYIIKRVRSLPAGRQVVGYQLLAISYLALYSILRFFLEFLRTDQTPIVLNLRFPQLVSLIIIIICLFYIFYTKTLKKSVLDK